MLLRKTSYAGGEEGIPSIPHRFGCGPRGLTLLIQPGVIIRLPPKPWCSHYQATLLYHFNVTVRKDLPPQGRTCHGSLPRDSGTAPCSHRSLRPSHPLGTFGSQWPRAPQAGAPRCPGLSTDWEGAPCPPCPVWNLSAYLWRTHKVDGAAAC